MNAKAQVIAINVDAFLAFLAKTGRCFNHLTEREKREAHKEYRAHVLAEMAAEEEAPTTVKVAAIFENQVGTKKRIDIWDVEFIRPYANTDIDYRKYNKAYGLNARPWIVRKTGIGYANLPNALRALSMLNHAA